MIFQGTPRSLQGISYMDGKRERAKSKVGKALSDFCYTLICPNTTKIGQDPSTKFLGKGFGELRR
ncbi:hypothetical protein DHD05_20820 [Arenibacter sp. N53]|uniref:hypothetical protein n=1 Tax=Arenibacter TaxID=178469 RepID=UPI000CD4381C|nr:MULTISPECIES: hypothetical protein [Arenibacter]MCM4154040.1 hypothetical protein [Arenibacter sp. N53]